MKLGRIKISDEFFNIGAIDELKKIFSEFVPLEIEDKRYSEGCRIYTGYSDQFEDKTIELEMPPFYDVEVIDSKIKFIKI